MCFQVHLSGKVEIVALCTQNTDIVRTQKYWTKKCCSFDRALAGHGALNPGQAASTCAPNVQTIEAGPNYGIPCDRADLIMINRGPQIMIHFIYETYIFDKNTMLNIVDRCDGGIKMGHWQCYCFINVRPRLWAIISEIKLTSRQGIKGRGQVAHVTFATELWLVICGRGWTQVWFVTSE